MTAVLCFAVFVVGGCLGLFIGCAAGMNGRADLLDELEAAEAEIAQLRRQA